MSRRVALLVAALALLAPASAHGALSGTPEQVATGLDHPWEVVLVPDGRTWVTERACRVDRIGDGGAVTPIFTDTSGVTCEKFLGLELHPGFATNHLVYLYETYTQDGAHRSRILRLLDTGGALTFQRVVFDGIGSDLNHDGGRMRFGPDGKLYVTTGDIHDKTRPQNVENLNGKILRLEAPGDDRDGSAPADNPFAGGKDGAPFVWSYGHRHPQGLAFDALGRLWETEHGPSGEGPAGAERSNDEINQIVKGGNYGWPLVAGAQTAEGTIPPAAFSGNTTTWAPAGAAIGPDGRLYVSTLLGRHVRQFDLGCNGLGAQRTYFDGGPRLRAATVGRGFFWFTTDGESSDSVRRVPITSDGFAGYGCAGPGTLAGAGAGGGGSGGGTGTNGGQAAQEQRRVAAAARLRVLLARARAGARRTGLRRLRQGRAVEAAVGGLGAGTLELRLVLKGRRIGTDRGRSAPTGFVTLRPRADRRGRRMLRRHRRVRLTLVARFAAPGLGGAVERHTRVVLRAR